MSAYVVTICEQLRDQDEFGPAAAARRAVLGAPSPP